jgi:hypothetical protein
MSMAPSPPRSREREDSAFRLSPTHNNIAGFADYDGETDPRKVPYLAHPHVANSRVR